MGERVSFKSNGSTTAGYLAKPQKPGPGVVVIQEWWGLVPHIEKIADRLSGAGFTALAPDLYHGQQTKSPDDAGKLMMSMRIDQAERDLAGAIDYLASLPEVKPKKVGTVGFCMGGALSLFAASKNPEVAACVVFYGGHPNVKPDLRALKAPVLGLYAGKDNFVTPEVVRDLDKQLTELGKAHEFHTYPNAQHAFFNDTRPEVHDPAAAKDAWDKTIAFFRRELGQ
jgi:carboxymethylenebutenolidase